MPHCTVILVTVDDVIKYNIFFAFIFILFCVHLRRWFEEYLSLTLSVTCFFIKIKKQFHCINDHLI